MYLYNQEDFYNQHRDLFIKLIHSRVDYFFLHHTALSSHLDYIFNKNKHQKKKNDSILIHFLFTPNFRMDRSLDEIVAESQVSAQLLINDRSCDGKAWLTIFIQQRKQSSRSRGRRTGGGGNGGGRQPRERDSYPRDGVRKVSKNF